MWRFVTIQYLQAVERGATIASGVLNILQGGIQETKFTNLLGNAAMYGPCEHACKYGTGLEAKGISITQLPHLLS
jgi:hypothetical protein